MKIITLIKKEHQYGGPEGQQLQQKCNKKYKCQFRKQEKGSVKIRSDLSM